jgi:hypothetical protein
MTNNQDLTGQTFGFLEVIEPVENQKSGHQLWRCHCNRCGNEIITRKYELLNGATISCGCYKKEECHKIATAGLKLINGTELGHLNGTTAYKNNKTGYRGVRKDPKTGRYIANINLSKHQYYLGTFDTPEEAYSAYMEAKERLHRKVLSDPSAPIPQLPPKLKMDRTQRRKNASYSMAIVSEDDLERYNKNRVEYKCIFYDKKLCKFMVRKMRGKTRVYLGVFSSLDEAKEALDQLEGEKNDR